MNLATGNNRIFDLYVHCSVKLINEKVLYYCIFIEVAECHIIQVSGTFLTTILKGKLELCGEACWYRNNLNPLATVDISKGALLLIRRTWVRIPVGRDLVNGIPWYICLSSCVTLVTWRNTHPPAPLPPRTHRTLVAAMAGPVPLPLSHGLFENHYVLNF
jgi:hypothetical protein